MYQQQAQGVYLCSTSSAYRIAAEIERPVVAPSRRTGTRSPAAAPQLSATAPGQVLVWDVTWVRSHYHGLSWPVYVVTDLFSRRIVASTVQDREDSDVACRLVGGALDSVRADMGVLPGVVHSDNGAIMVSDKMKKLLGSRGVEQSTNRPGVSNDNAFQESLFRLLKHGPRPPVKLRSLSEAAQYVSQWVGWYNTQWFHGGLGGYTPESVYDGSWRSVYEVRVQAKQEYVCAHPQRFAGRVADVAVPAQVVTINIPVDGRPALAQVVCG